MESRRLIIAAVVLVLIGVGLGVYWLSAKTSVEMKTHSAAMKAGVVSAGRVVNVDQVAGNPQKFTSPIGVEGTVNRVDGTNSVFTLGCEDEDVALPVKFNGLPPKAGSNVIAFGEVRKTAKGKYVFVAQKVKTK